MTARQIWGVIPSLSPYEGEAARTPRDRRASHPRVRAADAASYAAVRGLKLKLVTEDELKRGRLDSQAVDGFVLFEDGETADLLTYLNERFPGAPVIRSLPAEDERESVAVRLAYWPSGAIFDL